MEGKPGKLLPQAPKQEDEDNREKKGWKKRGLASAN